MRCILGIYCSYVLMYTYIYYSISKVQIKVQSYACLLRNKCHWIQSDLLLSKCIGLQSKLLLICSLPTIWLSLLYLSFFKKILLIPPFFLRKRSDRSINIKKNMKRTTNCKQTIRTVNIPEITLRNISQYLLELNQYIFLALSCKFCRYR